MVGSRRILGAAGGGFGAGLLLLGGGLIVKHTQAKTLAACSSGPGRFGQALDPNTAGQCGTAHDLSGLATGAIWIGAFLLVIAVGGFIAFLATWGVTASKKPKVVVPAGGIAPFPGPGREASAPSRAGEGPVVRPIVPVTVGQPVAASDESALPGTGSEITTVLPVFAPPEPVAVPAPAMATDRSAERSMAGVGPGSQLSWANRPPAPGGVDVSPPWGRADPPPAPGGSVTSSPPWEQAGSPAAPGVVASGPPRGQGGSPAAPGVVASGPPWEQGGSPAAPRTSNSEPPWGWAEPSPAPGGTRPDPEGIIPRQSGSGRHRSRRP